MFIRILAAGVLSVVIAGCGGGGSGSSGTNETYGAVAVKNTQFGSTTTAVKASISVSKETQAIADATAISECGTSCSVEYRFTNSWQCVSASRGRTYYKVYVSKADSLQKATDQAIAMCVQAGESLCITEDAKCFAQ